MAGRSASAGAAAASRPHSPFTRRVLEIVAAIPPGRVSTYGTIALHAGNPSGARQVARILHSSSRKYDLPWHRVINRQGAVSLPPGRGGRRQGALLRGEGVEVDEFGRVDLERYLWWPSS